MKNTALYLLIAHIFVATNLHAWTPEKVLLQSVHRYWDEVGLKSVYQVGSQVYLEIEVIDDPKTGHIGEPVALSKVLELPIPSFLCTITFDPPGDGSRILYQDNSWLLDYEIDANLPKVVSYDMEGEWDVTNYPWVYSDQYGYFYIYPISTFYQRDPHLSFYQRWVYSDNFGWCSKVPAFFPLAPPYNSTPLRFLLFSDLSGVVWP